MFSTTSRWGFPHKVARIVKMYEDGLLSIEDALVKLGDICGSPNIKTYQTYGTDGTKYNHTCIEFGCPVVVQYTF